MRVEEQIASNKIANLGFVAAVLVVCHHIMWGSLRVIYHFIGAGGLATAAVPFFFAVSGYFIAAHFDQANWWRVEARKRVKSLLVPFLLWSLIGFVIIVPRTVVAAMIAGRNWADEVRLADVWWWLNMVGLDFSCSHGSIGALWYLRSLFLTVVISPLLKFVNRAVGWLAIFFFYSIYVAHSSGWIPEPTWLSGFLSYSLSVQGVCYFSLGIILREHGICHMSNRVGLVAGLAGMSLLALRYVGVREFISIRAISVPLLLVFLWSITPTKRWPTSVVSLSFPLYLMHMLMISLFRAVPSSLTGPAAFRPVMCLIVCIGATFLLTRVVRSRFCGFAHLLFGGR